MPVTLPILLLTITLPKPSIFWHQTVDAEGKHHHFQCVTQEEYAGSWFYLYKGNNLEPIAEKKALPSQSKMMFAVHEFAPGEQFRCSYETQEAGSTINSPLSNPANITEDHYPKPFIAVSPGNEVFAGQDWIIRCWAPCPGVNFVLYQSREFRIEITPRGDSSVAEFFLNNVTMADAGRYTCYYHSTTEPVIWSNASDAVQLRVIDAGKVPSYLEVLVDSAGKYQVNCSVPASLGGWFYLYKGKQLIAETKVWQDGTQASFNLTEEALNTTQGELTCQYGPYPLNHTEVWTEASHTESTDFTTANSLRLGLGVSVLLLALFFITDACWTEVHEEN